MLLSVGGQMLPVLISHRHKKALLRVVILGHYYILERLRQYCDYSEMPLGMGLEDVYANFILVSSSSV